MRISNLHIRNFRSIRSLTVADIENALILVGKNNTGKTQILNALRAALGPDAPRTLESPALAAEDFSFYQKRVPGVFFFLGLGDTP